MDPLEGGETFLSTFVSVLRFFVISKRLSSRSERAERFSLGSVQVLFFLLLNRCCFTVSVRVQTSIVSHDLSVAAHAVLHHFCFSFIGVGLKGFLSSTKHNVCFFFSVPPSPPRHVVSSESPPSLRETGDLRAQGELTCLLPVPPMCPPPPPHMYQDVVFVCSRQEPVCLPDVWVDDV